MHDYFVNSLGMTYGIGSAIARELEVDKATICRDLKALQTELLARDESTLAAAAAIELRVTAGGQATATRFESVARALEAARQYIHGDRTARVEVLEAGGVIWSYPAPETTP